MLFFPPPTIQVSESKPLSGTQQSASLPNRGMASETWGRVSATRFRNTVNESKMVTPETEQRLVDTRGGAV